jgi:hypothetical protein
VSDGNDQLYVGDAITEVNGISLDGKTHEEVVRTLKEAGDMVGWPHARVGASCVAGATDCAPLHAHGPVCSS